MGSVWSRLGSEVTVIEYLDYITPGMDREISNEFKKILIKQGMKFQMNSKVNNPLLLLMLLHEISHEDQWNCSLI